MVTLPQFEPPAEPGKKIASRVPGGVKSPSKRASLN
jgi:hypothetical protein